MGRKLRWLAFALCASNLPGQTVSTEILGLVTDATGAVIPSAAIKVTRLATGDVRTATTNETGNYVFPLLEIGEYQVTCSASGFKSEVVRNVIVELQLNGRNFSQLATLMPGVTFGTSRIGTSGQGGTPIPGQTVQIAANGQRDIQQRITLDGVVATEPRINTMSFTPSIEAIEEFKVQSAVYSAEFGVNSGAQVSVAIKSGTNSLHGALFEFVRNDRFDARGFFLPPNQPKNKLRRNQYGAVVSGPVKRDRTFWLF